VAALVTLLRPSLSHAAPDIAAPTLLLLPATVPSEGATLLLPAAAWTVLVDWLGAAAVAGASSDMTAVLMRGSGCCSGSAVADMESGMVQLSSL